MPVQKIGNPESIIARKLAEPPGEDAEKGLITLPGEGGWTLSVKGQGTNVVVQVDLTERYTS